MSQRSLDGLKVVDLTQIVSGALATQMLADFGAEVIKVEPIGGETYRKSGFTLEGMGGSTNLNILRFSRGKRSIEINLKSPAGSNLLWKMLRDADVVIENFRPGVFERLGFAWPQMHEFNPKLIYTSVSGFGHDDVLPSPYKDRPSYAIIAEAMAGLTHLAGQKDAPPAWMGFAMSDIFAGTCAFAGTLLALRDRERTGEGTRVDIGMFDASLLMNDLPFASETLLGETMGRGQYALQSPWGPFAVADGYVIIAVLNPQEWARLCGIIGRPDLLAREDLTTGHQRSKLHDAVVAPAIEAWAGGKTRAEAVKLLQDAGVPCAPVNTTADLLQDPQVAARQMIVKTVTQELGEVDLVGNPIKVASSILPRTGVSPSLGEHTDEVLAEFGLTPQEVEALRVEGAIGG